MWTADFFSGCLLLASDPRRSVRGLYSSTGFQAAHPALLALQGPALVAYNDAKFTPRDFEALTKVGGATKRADSSKTGNYGQGFNAVYHLTDVQEAGQFRNPEPLGNLCFTEHEARTEGGGRLDSGDADDAGAWQCRTATSVERHEPRALLRAAPDPQRAHDRDARPQPRVPCPPEGPREEVRRDASPIPEGAGALCGLLRDAEPVGRRPLCGV